MNDEYEVGTYPASVYKAQGMVSVQVGCTMPDALVLMKNRAAIEDMTLDQITEHVLDRSIRFI